jgi:hypothetical protein
MSDTEYPYHQWVNEAFLNVFKRALTQLSNIGPSGDHHFFIDIKTYYEGVEIPKFLQNQYPEKITIVLQHQFDDLIVNELGFEVSLSFGGKKSHLKIPFGAVTSFADPSVNFGLQISDQSNIQDHIPNKSNTKSNESDVSRIPEKGLKIDPISNSLEKPNQKKNNDINTGKDGPSEMPEDKNFNDLSQTADVITLDAFRKK